MLKVCVVGAGAIGGFLGTRLASSGAASVAALARGTTLAALRDHGWRLEEARRRSCVRPWLSPATIRASSGPRIWSSSR